MYTRSARGKGDDSAHSTHPSVPARESIAASKSAMSPLYDPSTSATLGPNVDTASSSAAAIRLATSSSSSMPAGTPHLPAHCVNVGGVDDPVAKLQVKCGPITLTKGRTLRDARGNGCLVFSPRGVRSGSSVGQLSKHSGKAKHVIEQPPKRRPNCARALC